MLLYCGFHYPSFDYVGVCSNGILLFLVLVIATLLFVELLQLHSVDAAWCCVGMELCTCSVGFSKFVKREERKPTRCNNIDGLLSIMDVDY